MRITVIEITVSLDFLNENLHVRSDSIGCRIAVRAWQCVPAVFFPSIRQSHRGGFRLVELDG